MTPPIVGVPAFSMVALRAVLADLLAELALAQELDELRAEEDADQQRGRAAEQNPAHSALPRPGARRQHRGRIAIGRAGPRSAASVAATRSRPTPREPLTSTVSPSRSSRRRAAPRPPRASASAWPSPRELARASRAASGPTVTSSSTPRACACAPISRCRRGASAPSSSMSPSTATRRAGGRLGQVVDRRAHGHRVGVVAVVDHDDPAGQRAALPAQRREAHLERARAACSPSARAAATAASRLRRLCACANDGRSSIRSPRSSITHAAVLVALAQRHLAAVAEGDRARSSARRCGASSGSRAGTTTLAPRRAGPRSARPSRPRSPRASRAARGAPAPTLTITPTSGSAIAVSSAIWPAPAHRQLEHERLACRPARRAAPAAGRSRC